MNFRKWFVLTAICLLFTIPATSKVNEGDTLKFWSVSYVDWPPLWGTPQRQFKAVCQKAGTHCYIFVEVGATVPFQSAMDELVNQFDTHYYPALTQKYGPVPDACDHDSSVFIVALNENSWSGYFDPGQEMKDSIVYAHWNRRSNEREVIYLAANDFNYAEKIVSHEFGHLLHWGRDHSPEPSDPNIFWEAAFVDEGFSTFAAEYLTGNLFQHNVMDYSAFFGNDADIPLIYFSNYDQAQLFMTFMFEHFGQWNYISGLINNQLNSWQGVDSTLRLLGYSTTFKEAFEQFCIANYADDSVYQGGKYSYAHFMFPACATVNAFNSYPTNIMNGDLSPFGADYIVFNAASNDPVQIEFKGDSSSEFRLAFIMMNPSGNGIHRVVSVTPDAAGHAVFTADSMGAAYNKVVMVAMCTDTRLDTTERVNYSYSAMQTASQREIRKSSGFNVYPNPARDKLFINALDLSGAGGCSYLRIFDYSGQQKAVYPVNDQMKAVDISQLPSGVYFAELNTPGRSLSTRFVCIH